VHCTAVGAAGLREPPRARAGLAGVLSVHWHSVVQPGDCWQGTHSSARIADVSDNLPARGLKLVMVFRVNDQPGAAGGR